MSAELIAILVMSATLAGLMVAIWRDARTHTDQGLAQVRAEVRDVQTGIRDLRAEVRADNQRLREEARADMASFRTEIRTDMASLRTEIRADMQDLRTEVRADLAEVKSDVAGLRKDVQSLTERTSRLEGAIEGLFAGRTRHDDAA